MFDIVFILQHFVFYRDRTDIYLNTVDEERRRLIVEGRVPRNDDDEESHGNYL
jgi:cystinosin